MSGASFVAMAGGIYFKGYGYMALLVGWTGGYVLVATLLGQHVIR
jgi:cation/acetate symporter